MDLLERAKQKLEESKKVDIQEAKEIFPKISKPIEITEKESYSKSLDLNLIKCRYANSFGSTTNMRKADMQIAIINKQFKENEKIKEEVLKKWLK